MFFSYPFIFLLTSKFGSSSRETTLVESIPAFVALDLLGGPTSASADVAHVADRAATAEPVRKVVGRTRILKKTAIGD